jgi:hypothetical protein
MKNGRFNTPKCRGKLQKMGVLYTHSPKRPSLFLKLPSKNKNKNNFKKGGHSLTGQGLWPRPIGNRRSPVGHGPLTAGS